MYLPIGLPKRAAHDVPHDLYGRANDKKRRSGQNRDARSRLVPLTVPLDPLLPCSLVSHHKQDVMPTEHESTKIANLGSKRYMDKSKFLKRKLCTLWIVQHETIPNTW